MPTHYDKEFKQNIINLYKQGESAAQLSREYGICYSTVHKWTQAQTQNKSGKLPDEIKAMEKRLAALSEENEILKNPRLPCAEITDVFDYIQQESQNYQVAKMCRVLGVSRAHYYSYKAHNPSKRSLEDKDLKRRIFRTFVEFKQRYGVMKIQYELSKELQPPAAPL